MARLLKSRTNASIERDDEPSVLYVDHEQTEEVITALSSETALSVFRILNDRALTASEVAEELEVSVQNASYHLRNLREADLVEVIETCYSEKGREMDIYAVTSDPKVVVLGKEGDSASLRRAFREMAGAIGIPAVVIAILGSVAGLVDAILER